MVLRPVFIQRMQINVGQQRTEHRALSCSPLREYSFVLHEDRALQPPANEAEHPFIPHPSLDQGEEHRVVDGVERSIVLMPPSRTQFPKTCPKLR
jgi:hypothetical protein